MSKHRHWRSNPSKYSRMAKTLSMRTILLSTFLMVGCGGEDADGGAAPGSSGGGGATASGGAAGGGAVSGSAGESGAAGSPAGSSGGSGGNSGGSGGNSGGSGGSGGNSGGSGGNSGGSGGSGGNSGGSGGSGGNSGGSGGSGGNAGSPSALTPPKGMTKLYYEGFESGTLTWGLSGNKDSHLVNSPTRAGNYAAEMAITATSKVDYRSELVNSGKGAYNHSWGEERWMRFSNLIAKWESSGVAGKGIIWQLHGTPADWTLKCEPSKHVIPGAKGWMYSNLILLRAIDGKLRLTIQGTGTQPSNKGSNWTFAPFQLGVWNDWVAHFKLSLASDGFFKLYLNGKLVADQKGKNVDAASACGYAFKPYHYTKIGIYNAGRKGTGNTLPQVVNYDEIELWKRP